MAKGRKILAVNCDTGERKEFQSAWAFACAMGVTGRAVEQAVERGGVCAGWHIYDAPERIREKIARLKEILEIVEG